MKGIRLKGRDIIMQTKSRNKRQILDNEHKIETFMGVFGATFQIVRLCFKSIFPLIFVFALIGYIIQPYSIPTFLDIYDWMTAGLFVLGTIVIAILHGAIVYRLNERLFGEDVSHKTAIKYGFSKGGSIFILGLFYIVITLLGLMFLVFPGIYLAVALCLAPFLIVLREDEPKISLYERIKRSFLESYSVVKDNWWLAFSVLFILVAVSVGLEWLCQKFLIDQIVLASILVISIRAFFLTLAYICILTFIYSHESKLSSVEIRESNLDLSN